MVKIKEKVGLIVKLVNHAVDKRVKKRKGYPACRPTMSQCTSAAKKRKKGPGRIDWDKKSSGGEIRKQNRVKMKNGGFIAKGCGKVMNNRRKVTTIS